MKWIKAGAALTWAATAILWFQPVPEKQLHVWFLDVGEGDATLIQMPGGAVMLIDAGPPHGAEVVQRKLREEGLGRVDVFVWTHPQADHIGGALKVMQSMNVGMVLEPRVPYPSETYAKNIQLVQEKSLKWIKAWRGQTIDFGDGSKAEILNPAGEPYEDVNDACVVIRLTYGKESFVFPGDAGYLSEGRIVAKCKELRADVLKAGHHGSRSACSESWLHKVDPKYVVISCGKGNRFGHPHTETMEKLRRLGSKVYRTDEDGTVECTTDGRSLNFRLAAAR